MKNLLIIVCLAALLSGCSSAKFVLVGDVNMISTRNVDSQTNYVLMRTGADDSKAFFKKNKGLTLDQAINNVVTNVPGGEFLKNAKIYTDRQSWAVIGDVWGVPESANVEGFRVGDKVLIKNSILNKDNFSKGEITGFKDRKTCIVRVESGEMKEIEYTDLSKATN